MSTVNIALPDALRDWVEHEAKAGGFASLDEYVVQLVQTARVAKERQTHLESLLLEGVSSGEAQPVTSEWWNEVFAEADARLPPATS